MIKVHHGKMALQTVPPCHMRVPVPSRFIRYQLSEGILALQLQPWVEDWLGANAKGEFTFRHTSHYDGITVEAAYVIDFADPADGVYFRLWSAEA